MFFILMHNNINKSQYTRRTQRIGTQICTRFIMVTETALKSNDTTAIIKANDWSYWNIFYPCLAIVCCTIVVCPITLAPQHNVFESPEYWYEFPVATTVCVLSYWSILAIIRFHVFFQDIGFVVRAKNWLYIFLAFVIPYNLMYCITYIIWRSTWLTIIPFRSSHTCQYGL